MLQIDLSSPAGNAFVLISQAKFFARQLEYTKEAAQALEHEMMSGDYEHLLDTFSNHFGQYVELVGRDETH